MTSPTATFCCLLPLRTIAYTATHSPRHAPRRRRAGELIRTAKVGGHASTRRGSTLRDTRAQGQNDAWPLALASAPLLDRDVQHRVLVLVRLPRLLRLGVVGDGLLGCRFLSGRCARWRTRGARRRAAPSGRGHDGRSRRFGSLDVLGD